jgi:hypothetical protein
VIIGTCSVATEARDLHGRCGTEFSLRTEDKKNYGLSWSPFDADSLGATRKTGPWLYHTAWELGTSPVKGTQHHHDKTCIFFKDPS